MTNALKTRLSRFTRADEGNVTFEAIILMPILIIIFAACWVYFDVFREQAVNQKANYVIGDALSRETDEINDTYIDNSYKLLKLFTRTGDGLYDESTPATTGFSDGELYPTDLRITVVSYKQSTNRYAVEWSVVRGDPEVLVTADLTGMRDRLPLLADGAQVILVETWDDYHPVFNVGLGAFPIKAYSFTQPRYTPQLLYVGASSGNNGWGNGDQDAAGNSLCNNNAENATDCDNTDGAYNNEPSWDS